MISKKIFLHIVSGILLAKNLKSFIYLWLIENYPYDFNSKL